MCTFKTLGLSNSHVEALSRQQIIAPTDIQILGYPNIRERKDIWLSAPTGSGKTLAYLLPLLASIDSSTTDLQVAILSPTQELAVQIHDCIRALEAGNAASIRSQLLIGSASSQRQKEKLKKKPHIVVGTLGRMLELGRIRKLKLHLCQSVVIDEADNLLAEDRITEVEAFLKMTPRDRQLVFTSATHKGDAFYTAESLGKDVQWHSAAAPDKQTAIIEHSYVETRYHNKGRVLHKLLNSIDPERAIVFVHRNENAEALCDELEGRHPKLSVIHGELSKFARQKAVDRFRRGKIKVLIASDVAARGLDIKGVTHIFNVDLPSSSDDYIHRAGRTGRMGANGHTISLASEDEFKLIRRYERDLHIDIERIDVT
ncbi:MAG: DEAD/DEAH box helicase [Lentimonas sp.]